MFPAAWRNICMIQFQVIRQSSSLHVWEHLCVSRSESRGELAVKNTGKSPSGLGGYIYVCMCTAVYTKLCMPWFQHSWGDCSPGAINWLDWVNPAPEGSTFYICTYVYSPVNLPPVQTEREAGWCYPCSCKCSVSLWWLTMDICMYVV